MKGTTTTHEEIEYIVKAFKEGISIKEIAKDVGKCQQTILNILAKEGMYTPVSRDPAKRENIRKKVTEVKCPNCRATGHYKGAKFCYKCGADVRTESDILRERLGKLMADIQFLPESVKDNFYTVIQETCDYLRKVG